MSRRTPWTVAVLVAAGACLTACVQVPDHGPVVQAQNSVQDAPNDNPFNNPPPPPPGASSAAIVSGFLDAMTATPLQTRVAVKYLTHAAASSWKPQNGGVVAYAGLQPPHGQSTVKVHLRGADHIGPAGQWLGPVGPAASRLTFPMRKESGEWRIASAPNALLVPRTFYAQAFQDAALYYFDPTGRILVPEVVHMPQGQQLITALVQALLLGPSPSLSGVVRTFVPSGLAVGPLVVSQGSVAVTLTGPDPGPLDRRTTRLMLSQLAWTLRQDPTVTTFSVSISGRQVTDASGASSFRVDSPEAARYDPAVPLASSQLYALRRGLLVSGQANRLTPVGGPFGTSVEGVGPFAVSLDDDQVAATTQDSLLLGPVRSGVAPTQVLTGTGLLTPAWDFANRLWEVQNRTRGGAVVLDVSRGGVETVRVPGVSGEDVRRFLVSRDGSRLVAVVRGTHHDRIVVSRLQYDGNRRVSGTRAQPIPWATSASTRVRDIGWMSPTTIAVLHQVSRAQAEVGLFDVDGSMSPDDVSPIVVQGRALSLATSPASASLTPPFAVLPGELFDLAQVDSNQQQAIARLHHVTYAG
jgi:hypothetical protein